MGFLKPAKAVQESRKGKTRKEGMTVNQGGKAKAATLWESGFRKKGASKKKREAAAASSARGGFFILGDKNGALLYLKLGRGNAGKGRKWKIG
jgi:uncharacterized protein with beta-barrel porin domain